MAGYQPYIIAILAGLPGLVAALAAYLQSRSTHLAVNSRMDELLRVSRQSSFAAGQLQGPTGKLP